MPTSDSVGPQAVLAPAVGVVSCGFDAELAVLEPVSKSVLLLDAVAAEVFRLLDGVRTLGEVSHELSLRYDATPAQIGEDVGSLVAELVANGTLVAVRT
jgi:hypothetical protein